jgi:hypothetical protein
MPLSQPKSVLLEILVGTATPQVISYYDGTPAPNPVRVNVGDHVAWLVTVAFANGRKALPYTVNFDDPTFFGVASVQVPAGGTSQFLQVLSVAGLVSYSPDVTGIGCVFDPEIQSGGGPLICDTKVKAPTVTVTWNTDSNLVSYNNGLTAFPIKVKVGDTVTFSATNNAGTGSNFFILFAPGANAWASPFNLTTALFPGSTAMPLSTGALIVADNVDPAGATFQFSGSIVLNGQTQTTDPAKVYSIQLA